jgi:hypothetical protein
VEEGYAKPVRRTGGTIARLALAALLLLGLGVGTSVAAGDRTDDAHEAWVVDQSNSVNSGGGTAANVSEFDVYAFALNGFSMTPSPPNAPAPRLVLSQDDREHADSHGATLTRQGRYLWVADRAGNRVVVIETKTDQLAGEFSLLGSLSDDPSPDLLDVSPSGRHVFASLRGALPLSGDPHASTGSTPGVGVIRVVDGGRRGELRAIARMANVDPGGIDRADPHALRVRVK